MKQMPQKVVAGILEFKGFASFSLWTFIISIQLLQKIVD